MTTARTSVDCVRTLNAHFDWSLEEFSLPAHPSSCPRRIVQHCIHKQPREVMTAATPLDPTGVCKAQQGPHQGVHVARQYTFEHGRLSDVPALQWQHVLCTWWQRWQHVLCTGWEQRCQQHLLRCRQNKHDEKDPLLGESHALNPDYKDKQGHQRRGARTRGR
jgi:hypothetical protein